MVSHKIYSLHTPIEFYVSDFPYKLKMYFVKTFTLTYRYRKYVFLILKYLIYENLEIKLRQKLQHLKICQRQGNSRTLLILTIEDLQVGIILSLLFL